MGKRYGVPMQTYGHILPGATSIARLTPLSQAAKRRLAWLDHYYRYGNGRLTCRYFGIPPKTLYKWQKRYGQRGLKGLEDSSKRPRRFRVSRLPIEHVQAVIAWRTKYPMYSKYKLAVLLRREDGLALSPSTIGRILIRHKLFFPTSIAPKKKRHRSVLAKQRLHPYYRSKLPGELGEADMKHVSFFGQRRSFFVGLDCVSKRLAVEVGTTNSSRQASLILDRMKAFPFPIQKIRVDNGAENLKEFAAKAAELKIEQYFTRYRRPKDKPFVERVIGTIEREFIQQGKLAIDLDDQRRLVKAWVNEYNTFRPHQSLGYLTPEQYELRFQKI